MKPFFKKFLLFTIETKAECLTCDECTYEEKDVSYVKLKMPIVPRGTSQVKGGLKRMVEEYFNEKEKTRFGDCKCLFSDRRIEKTKQIQSKHMMFDMIYVFLNFPGLKG